MLNKPIPDLDKIKMIVLDSDGVCVPRGTVIEEREDNISYNVYVSTSKIDDELAEKINALKKKYIIVISSGRSLLYLQSIYDKILGGGTVLMAENGNIWLMNGKIENRVHPEDYLVKLEKIKTQIKKLPIDGFEPKQFILTVHCDTELAQVYEIVKRYDSEGELKVMWNGEAFDIQKKEVSKGEGLRKLMDTMGFVRENVIVIGDRINDKELLEEGIGVSADKEKLPAEYWTTGKGLPGEILIDYLHEISINE